MTITSIVPLRDARLCSFCPFDSNNQDHVHAFEECFHPKNGISSEEKSALLRQIEERVHCQAEFLMHEQEIVGIVVYGKKLSDIVMVDPSHNWLEIQLLSLRAFQAAGQGYRTKLLDRVIKVAQDAHAVGLYTWLPIKDTPGIRYFKSNSFKSLQLIDERRTVNQLFFHHFEQTGRIKRARTEDEVLQGGFPHVEERALKRHEHPSHCEPSALAITFVDSGVNPSLPFCSLMSGSSSSSSSSSSSEHSQLAFSPILSAPSLPRLEEGLISSPYCPPRRNNAFIQNITPYTHPLSKAEVERSFYA